MSEATVIFNFKGEKIKIKCINTEKMENICERFTSEIKVKINKLYFKYNGNLINEELKYEELANVKDKDIMNIIVEEENKRKINDKIKLEENKDKINDNYIIAEINIKEEDINKQIRIINSYEECNGKYYGWIDNEDNYISENEGEIKEKCQIKINNEEISFNYYYRFKKAGKYVIEYIFKENIINANFFFLNANL